MSTETKTAHTPGPCEVEAHESVSGGTRSLNIKTRDDGRIVAIVSNIEGNAEYDRLDANAALYAAAPSMLDALSFVYEHILTLPHTGNAGTWRFQNQATLCRLRDTICEATGRDDEDVQVEHERRALLQRVEGRE